jgi:hypothetical protein
MSIWNYLRETKCKKKKEDRTVHLQTSKLKKKKKDLRTECKREAQDNPLQKNKIKIKMALLSSSPSLSITSPNYRYYPSRRLCLYPISATRVVTPHHIDKSSLTISETSSEDQLWAAACLRVRSFHEFKPSTFGIQVSLWFSLWISKFIFEFCVWLPTKLKLINNC